MAVRARLVLCSVGALTGLALAAEGAAGVTYADVTSLADIDFPHAGEVHEPDTDWPAFPEIMGGGACWADFDGDGYDDLYLVNQRFNPLNPAVGAWANRLDPHNELYMNNGDGSFTERAIEAGVAGRAFGYGCSAADNDGDADVDLFVANFGDNAFFSNRGDGTFDNATAESGLGMTGACGDYSCMSTSSAWADYDLDGDLDLYVGNYVETTLTDLGRGPSRHIAQVNWLHRNNGDGTFTEVAESAGVAGNPTDQEGSKTLGVIWFDYDLDGDMDLYAANDMVPNDFYQNQGDGTFIERDDAGLADPRASMGVASGDYDGDGRPDLFFTHYQDQENGFYRNRGDGTFEDRSGEDGLAASWDMVGWGTAFVDVDRDADLDIVLVNGHTEHTATSASVAPHYEETAQVFLQGPSPDPLAPPWDREWSDATSDSGPGITSRRVARGAAFADYDLDGDTDLAIVNNANDTAELVRASGVNNHSLTVLLRQDGMNRFGIGARVILEAGGVAQYREVQTGTSYLSQNSLNLEFGLGAGERADRITVEWPGGGTTTVLDVLADQVIRIDRTTGSYVVDTLAPRTRAVVPGLAGSGWANAPVEATLVAEDIGVTVASGVALTQYAVADGPFQTFTGEPVQFASEGTTAFHYRSLDNAGNLEPTRTTPIRIDLTAPQATHDLAGTSGLEGWYVGPPVTVTLTGTDGLSGVAGIRHRTDGGAWSDYAAPFAFTAAGVHVLEYEARDVAGNAGALGSVEIRWDPEGPDVAITRPARGTAYAAGEELGAALPAPAPAVVVALAAPIGTQFFAVTAQAGDSASGVNRVVFLVDGEMVSVDQAIPFEWAWDTAGSMPGMHEIQAVAVDVAGNLNVAATDVVLVGGSFGTGLAEPPAGMPGPASWITLTGVLGIVARGRRSAGRGPEAGPLR